MKQQKFASGGMGTYSTKRCGEVDGYSVYKRQIDADWSEDAFEYTIPDLGIKNQCEGDENILKYAKEDIDKKMNKAAKGTQIGIPKAPLFAKGSTVWMKLDGESKELFILDQQQNKTASGWRNVYIVSPKNGNEIFPVSQRWLASTEKELNEMSNPRKHESGGEAYSYDPDKQLASAGFDVAKLSTYQKDLILERLDGPENYYQDGELNQSQALANWVRKLKAAGLSPKDIHIAVTKFEKGGKAGDECEKRLKKINALCTKWEKGSDYLDDEGFVNAVFDIIGRPLNNGDTWASGGTVVTSECTKKIKKINALCTKWEKGSDYLDDEGFVNAVFDIIGRPLNNGDTWEAGGTVVPEGELKVGDKVENAVGEKLLVEKVTADEYWFGSFGGGTHPFGKEKVDNYIKSGYWQFVSGSSMANTKTASDTPWFQRYKFEKGGSLNESELYNLQGLDNSKNGGFTIKQMREFLDKKFPDSFQFSLNAIKEGTDSRGLEEQPHKSMYGIDDDKLRISFTNTKRNRGMAYQIYQGGENTYFKFLLSGSDGNEYIGNFGFKDEGMVPSDFVTKFVAFLQEAYSRPFSVQHLVYASGGDVSGRIKVGTFNESQLKNKEDKIAVEKAQKETGLTYVDTKIIKKGGKMYLEVYLIPNKEYFARGGEVDHKDLPGGGYAKIKKHNNDTYSVTKYSDAEGFTISSGKRQEEARQIFNSYADGGKTKNKYEHEFEQLSRFGISGIAEIKPRHNQRDDVKGLADWLDKNDWVYGYHYSPNNELPYVQIRTKNVSREKIAELYRYIKKKHWEYSNLYADGGTTPTEVKVGQVWHSDSSGRNFVVTQDSGEGWFETHLADEEPTWRNMSMVHKDTFHTQTIRGNFTLVSEKEKGGLANVKTAIANVPEKAYIVVCESVGNPDFGQNPNAPISPTRSFVCYTLRECSDACRKYIDEWDLGGGNWSGGQIYDTKGIVAYVSYNGRIWKKSPSEWKYGEESITEGLDDRLMEKGGAVDSRELWYVSNYDGRVKNISLTHEDAREFLSKALKNSGKIGVANVPLKDWEANKVNVGNIKEYRPKYNAAESGEMEKGGKLSKGLMSLKKFVETKAESIIKHYLPGSEPTECAEANEFENIGDYIIDEDTAGDGSPEMFIEVYFGDKYDEACKEIDADYKQFASYIQDKADTQYLRSAEVLNNDEGKTFTFLFSDFKKGYEGGGFTQYGEPMGFDTPKTEEEFEKSSREFDEEHKAKPFKKKLTNKDWKTFRSFRNEIKRDYDFEKGGSADGGWRQSENVYRNEKGWRLLRTGKDRFQIVDKDGYDVTSDLHRLKEAKEIAENWSTVSGKYKQGKKVMKAWLSYRSKH